MDIALSLMMTAIALWQEAETPIGHVASYDPEDAGKDVDPMSEFRDGVVDAVSGAFYELEDTELDRPESERGLIYMDLRDSAEQFAMRFSEDEEEEEEEDGLPIQGA